MNIDQHKKTCKVLPKRISLAYKHVATVNREVSNTTSSRAKVPPGISNTTSVVERCSIATKENPSVTPIASESPHSTTPANYVWSTGCSYLPFAAREHQGSRFNTETFRPAAESRIDVNHQNLQQQEVGSYSGVFDPPFDDSAGHFST